MVLDVKLFTEGGRTWSQALEDVLEEADITLSQYRKDEARAGAQLTRQGRIVVARITDPSSPAVLTPSAGVRWEGLFALAERTEGRHPLIIIDSNLYFPNKSKQSLLKNTRLVPVKRWETEPPANNPVLRDGYEEARRRFDITSFQTLNELPIGFDVESVSTSNVIGVTTPFDWVRAKSAYNDEGLRKKAKIVCHVGRQDYSNVLANGMLVHVQNVPTFSGDTDPHKITIRHTPVYDVTIGITTRTKIAGRDMKIQDDCYWETFADYRYEREMRPAFGKSERRREENLQDYHAVLGLLGASDWLRANHPQLALDLPYPDLSQRVERLVQTAYHRIVVRTTEYSNSNGNQPTVKFEMMSEYVSRMKMFTTLAWIYEASLQRRQERELSRRKTA